MFVYNGKYDGGVDIVSKSLNLIGEDKETAVIIGSNGISVDNSNHVNIQSFTIIVRDEIMVIFSKCSNCIFFNNNIQSNLFNVGLYISDSTEINILKNAISIIKGNCIVIEESKNCIIKNNYIGYNTKLTYGKIGIAIPLSDNVTILNNQISKCSLGVLLDGPGYINVIQNNFILNIAHARIENSGRENFVWDGNFWGRPRFFPKLIHGGIVMIIKGMLWINIDWHPAKEPYDI